MSLSPLVLARSIPARSTPPARRLRRSVRAVGLFLALAALLAPSAHATLSNVRVDRTTFSPNGDGIRDTVHVEWTVSPAPESLRVEIRPAAQGTTGPSIREFAYGPGPAGTASVAWDGRATGGALAAEGLYLCRVLELADGGATVVTDAVTSTLLDVTPPPVPRFDDGLDGRDTTAAVALVLGTAPAADSVAILVGGVRATVVRIATPDSVFQAEVPIVPGPNAIAAQGLDRAGNRGPLSPAITITYRVTSDITLLRAQPFEFSPNADGVLDTVRADVTIDAPTTRLLVQVRAAVPIYTGDRFADSVAVRTLYNAPAAAGEHLFDWDGRDSTGAAVGDGNWFFMAQAESADVAGDPVPGRRAFTRFVLDRVAPGVPVPVPVPPARTTRNTYHFTGVVAGADSVRVYRDDTIVARVTAPNWSALVPLFLGDNVFSFDSGDRAGNRSPRSAPIVIRYEEPLGFHAPERFRATDVFDVNLTRAGRSVRIDLYALGGRRVRTLVSDELGDRYELPWNLRDEDGRVVGDGPYVARLTVTYLDGSRETSSGAIVVAK